MQIDAYPHLKAFLDRPFLSNLDVSRAAIEAIVQSCDSSVGYFHRYSESSQTISLGVWSSQVSEICKTIHRNHYPLKDAGIWADSIRERGVVLHNNYVPTDDSLPEGHFPIKNHMSAPIVRDDQIVAVIGVGNSSDDYSDEDAKHFLKIIDLAWDCMQENFNEVLIQQLERKKKFEEQNETDVLLNLIQAISRALELRDSYTSKHQSTVSDLCLMVGKKLSWPKQQLQGLCVGASIHDIGKIGIPIGILTKTAPLNNSEFELIKEHSKYGADIFQDIQLPWDIYSMILQHHERMDGSGYPLGLSGDQICMEARIIAVADTYEAISNPRPYRKARGINQAIEVLLEGRGTLFDYTIVDTFIECILEEGLLSDITIAPTISSNDEEASN